MTQPVQEPNTNRWLEGHSHRVSQLERRAGGPWIYVGTWPDDPGTTPDSPPFENGWANMGGLFRRMRFRWNLNNQVDIEGAISGGADDTVCFTLPDGYRPDEEDRLTATDTSNVLVIFGIATNGEVTVNPA